MFVERVNDGWGLDVNKEQIWEGQLLRYLWERRGKKEEAGSRWTWGRGGLGVLRPFKDPSKTPQSGMGRDPGDSIGEERVAEPSSLHAPPSRRAH